MFLLKQKGKDKRKSVTFAEEENQYGPVLAARYLTYLITHPVCRAAVLSHHPRELIQIQEQLQESMVREKCFVIEFEKLLFGSIFDLKFYVMFLFI